MKIVGKYGNVERTIYMHFYISFIGQYHVKRSKCMEFTNFFFTQCFSEIAKKNVWN